MGDAVKELAASLVAIATERIDACCAWPGEPHGAYIDLARRPKDLVAVAVQETVELGAPTLNENVAEWLRGRTSEERRAAHESSWLPLRGTLLFGARLPTKVLLTAFWSGLVLSRSALTQGTYESLWGHPFPEALVEQLADLL